MPIVTHSKQWGKETNMPWVTNETVAECKPSSDLLEVIRGLQHSSMMKGKVRKDLKIDAILIILALYTTTMGF